MNTISNVDRVILIIRQRLKEHAKTARASASPAAKRNGLEHVQALAALDGLDPARVKRVLIEQILSDEFGPERVNDAAFQQIVQRVFEGLDGAEGTRRLMDAVVADLRKSPP